MKILNSFILILFLFQNNLESSYDGLIGTWTICKIISKKDGLTVNFNTCHEINFNTKNTGKYIIGSRKFKFNWCLNNEYLIINKRKEKDKFLSTYNNKYNYQLNMIKKELKLSDNDYIYILRK
ncbi:hypothetical protein [Chryseobacterium binzhouense]|uniref:hypothetical protein n=1 Tax=Chryseobacterium binzhouense TaxID=2593646 RepID=UPI00117BFCED|nr:hypothetical protein [Chryseobacterium binzhouense]